MRVMICIDPAVLVLCVRTVTAAALLASTLALTLS